MRTALFVSCLVDLWRPRIGRATLKLLASGGVRPAVPPQSCCGQPAYNAGDRALARQLARGVLREFADYDAVIVPSGSCAGMLKVHYPMLFKDMPEEAAARRLADRTFELSQYLTTKLPLKKLPGGFQGRIAYHDSCSARRELTVYAQPRHLLALLPGVTLAEIPEGETCCGFGGSFAVKYDAISTRLADRKCVNLNATGACALVAGDLGCLLHLEGRLRRRGDTRTRVLHLAEVLAEEDGSCA